MDKSDILAKTSSFVKEQLDGEGSGHDFWHIERVKNTALHIARKENDCDEFVVEMAALLHDVADPKLHNGDNSNARKLLHTFVESLGIHEEVKKHIFHIVENSSFSKSLGGKEIEKSKEFMIVQDADRLDALGAIGIGRCFMYSGHKSRPMYDPTIPAMGSLTKEEYRSNKGTAINHFYEKLFLLKDTMNTTTGKELAQERHEFMQHFVSRFLEEWEGKK